MRDVYGREENVERPFVVLKFDLGDVEVFGPFDTIENAEYWITCNAQSHAQYQVEQLK